MKDTIPAHFAVGEGLSSIAESVGKRFDPGIDNLHPKVILDQRKPHLTPASDDRAFFDVSRYEVELISIKDDAAKSTPDADGDKGVTGIRAVLGV